MAAGTILLPQRHPNPASRRTEPRLSARWYSGPAMTSSERAGRRNSSQMSRTPSMLFNRVQKRYKQDQQRKAALAAISITTPRSIARSQAMRPPGPTPRLRPYVPLNRQPTIGTGGAPALPAQPLSNPRPLPARPGHQQVPVTPAGPLRQPPTVAPVHQHNPPTPVTPPPIQRPPPVRLGHQHIQPPAQNAQQLPLIRDIRCVIVKEGFFSIRTRNQVFRPTNLDPRMTFQGLKMRLQTMGSIIPTHKMRMLIGNIQPLDLQILNDFNFGPGVEIRVVEK